MNDQRLPASSPALTVVIVNWERPADTVECLQSLYQHAVSGMDVLLVDNGSQDDSVHRIRQAYPDLTLLALPENLGFAGGYNAGMLAALQRGAERIFILNNDTVLQAGALQALLAAPWDVAVPKVVYYNQPDRIWAAGCRWRRWPPSVIMNGYNRPDGPAYNQPMPLDYATGCALLVDRQVILTTGGFDPRFVNYMEDYDFAYRLRQAGFTMGYVPQAVIHHKVSQTLGAASPARWRFQARSTVLFYCQHQRFPRRSLWAFLTWLVLRETLKGNLRLLPAILAGIREGLALCPRQAPSKESL